MKTKIKQLMALLACAVAMFVTTNVIAQSSKIDVDALQTMLKKNTIEIARLQTDLDVMIIKGSPAQEITQMQQAIALLNTEVAYLQTQINDLLAQQAQEALAAQQKADNAGSAVHTNAITTAPDHNNPNFIPSFISTGDPDKDAIIIHNWLLKHGLIKQ